LIKDFFELNKYRNLSIKNVKFNQWFRFKNKWDKL
jgi:hypothetical protein